MVLIYTKDVDDFVNQVIDCLDTDFVRIGESDKIEIVAMDFSSQKNSYRIKSDYIDHIDLEKIKSVWLNGGCIAVAGDEYENKCCEVLNDAFVLQKPIKRIGKRIADFETNRLDVMLEAKGQGLKIPHTLATGNKTVLQDFRDTYKDKNGIICKRILDTYFYADENFLYNFNLTFPITDAVFNEIPEAFAISFFQERIVADFEIRVIYIDGQFFSVAIHNFDDNIDYRTKLIQMNNLRIVPFRLPLEIESRLDAVFRRFNLNYGSADLMYCNGEYYFLEINPTGQISFVNNACNFYIETILAQKLSDGK